MAQHPQSRRSSRVIVQNIGGNVLLMRFVIRRNGAPFAFWATPGGRVECGETDLAAAQRELREELGLELAMTGPVYSTVERFEHEGTLVENTDVFFYARGHMIEPSVRGVTEAERAAMREVRWWTLDEIDESAEIVFPAGLARLVRGLA